MASVSSTFTAATLSASLFVPHGQTFRLALSGTWVGTVRVEESENGAISFAVIDSASANIAQDYAAAAYDRVIRLNCYGFTSGTVTYAFSNVGNTLARLRYSNVPIGQVAYGSVGTSTTPVAGTLMLTDLDVGGPFTATGIGVLNAATVGTNKYVLALYDRTGALVATTALAGTLTAGTNVFQQVAFTAPVFLPSGVYFIAVQLDGTTDRLRTVATLTNINVLGSSQIGVFGTIPATITPPTTFTADLAPVSYIY